jgi:pSer/pThr/pTyr-binding forkhead associated (FHA) protein
VVWGERQIALFSGETIGRAPEARISVDLARVSRRHARIVVTNGRAVLEDLGSKNGTFLRGARVAQPTELVDGDEIWAGSLVLVFRNSLGDTTETGTGR